MADFDTEIQIHGRRVMTLGSYNTPYYYLEGSSAENLGRVQHFMTLRRLKNHVERQIRAGKFMTPKKEA